PESHRRFAAGPPQQLRALAALRKAGGVHGARAVVPQGLLSARAVVPRGRLNATAAPGCAGRRATAWQALLDFDYARARVCAGPIFQARTRPMFFASIGGNSSNSARRTSGRRW